VDQAPTSMVLAVVGERRRLRRRRGVGRGVARVVVPFVVVAALVVLAVGSVAQIGPASGPDRRTVDRSYAVLATPIVMQSNASGSALNALVTHGPTLARTTLFSDISALVSATATDDRSFDALTPPVPTDDVAGRCGSAMDDRERAAAQVGGAFERLLGGRRGIGGGNEAAAARAVEGAGTMLESADTAWAACRRSLRLGPGSARLPASKWVTDPGLWAGSAVGQLVAAFLGSGTLIPVHHLTLTAVSSDPAAVPGTSAVSVLPPTRALRVQVVVTNQGNVDERGVQVEVTAAPSGTVRPPAPVHRTTDVAAGRSVTVFLPPLAVHPGASYALAVTATPGEGGQVASLSASVRVSVVTSTTTTTTTTTRPTRTSVASTTTTSARSG
jgi:hypothetical protein